MEEKNRFLHDPLDEVLEAVWILGERRLRADVEHITGNNEDGFLKKAHIDSLVEEGLLTEKDGVYVFTEAGRVRGRDIIRRHRLAERLMTDVLSMKEDNTIESDACRFEHVLSPELTDHICILLGHPRLCPHGKSIPPGRCCETAQHRFESAVVPLNMLKCGESGRVLYMTMKQHDRLDRLTSLGLFPGREVKVHQREPLFVLFIDETQLALEKSIVEDIYVVRK